MNALDHIVKKFDLETWRTEKMPIHLHGVLRSHVLDTFNELGFKIGVEIGVERARLSKAFCDRIPGIKLFGVDPWKIYNGYEDYRSQEQLDQFLEITLETLKPYPNVTLLKKTSAEALAEFEDGSLDFVYIDGNHDLFNVIHDITFWEKKVRPGGIISGHDYARRTTSRRRAIHVIDGVVAYTKCYDILPWFTFGNKKEIGSFMWVKE